MPSYHKQKTISTYAVSKSAVEMLEEYLIKNVPEILYIQITDTQKNRSIFEVILHDSHGQESYSSIKEYKLPLFRDDIKGITLSYKLFSQEKDVSISIRFGLEQENTDLSICLNDDNAKEKVSAIENGLTSILNSQRTLNWLLFPNQLIGSITILGTMYFGLVAISSDVTKKEAFIYGCLFWAGLSYFWIFHYFKKYSTFDTPRQKQLDKGFAWFITGLAGLFYLTHYLPQLEKICSGFNRHDKAQLQRGHSKD
jgi:hypothetical protein